MAGLHGVGTLVARNQSEVGGRSSVENRSPVVGPVTGSCSFMTTLDKDVSVGE